MGDLKEIETIVNESGNSFHCKVANYLRDTGWYTLISPYYMDSATSKPREIDLIAEKHWFCTGRFQGRSGNLIIKLFVECKYISQPNVFWFSDKDLASAKQWVAANTPLRGDDSFMSKHHYLSTNPKVAKLFASKNRPNPENEAMYRALNQSLNAMVCMRWRQDINPELRGAPVLATVQMPVILCNSFDDFYRVEMDDPGEPKSIYDNFQLEVNYAYLDDQKNNRAEYFLIDMVDFNKVDDFLGILETEKDVMSQFLRYV